MRRLIFEVTMHCDLPEDTPAENLRVLQQTVEELEGAFVALGAIDHFDVRAEEVPDKEGTA